MYTFPGLPALKASVLKPFLSTVVSSYGLWGLKAKFEWTVNPTTPGGSIMIHSLAICHSPFSCDEEGPLLNQLPWAVSVGSLWNGALSSWIEPRY